MPVGTLRARWIKTGLAVLTVIGLGAWLSVHYLGIYKDLKQGEKLLSTVAETVGNKAFALTSDEVESLQKNASEAQRRFDSGAGALASGPLFKLAKCMPWLGPKLETAERLAKIGDHSSRAAELALSTIAELHMLQNSGESPLKQVVPYLDHVSPYIAALEAEANDIKKHRQSISEGDLFPQLRAPLVRLDRWLGRLGTTLLDYHHAQEFVPGFFGYNRPRTYLILNQDNTELFPSGGFINPYGLLTIERGRITQLHFEDVYNLLERWQASGAAYIEPPAALKNHMLRDWSWGIGEAGWSPDFPTSALDAQRLLKATTGLTVDGVIALDFAVLEGLLRFTGPVVVEEYGVTVDADNAYTITLEEALDDLNSGKDRSTFVQHLSRKLLDFLSSIPPTRWPQLMDMLPSLMEEKHLLTYSNDGSLQAVMAERGWTGALRPSASDYLMVVDASVNSTKLNLVVEETIALDVRLDEVGNAHNAVTIYYSNNLPSWAKGRDPQLVHRMMGHGLYGDYVRLFIAPGSRVVSVTQDGIEVGLEEISREGDKTVFGRYFALSGGQRKEIAFRYFAPKVVEAPETSYQYHLTLQKQPGTRALPIAITIRPPTAMEVVSFHAPTDGQASLSNNVLIIEMDLRIDREFTVFYRKSRNVSSP